MPRDSTCTEVFAAEPDRWGLRGDPHAWAAMAQHLAERKAPTTYDEALQVLRSAFEHVVGVAVDGTDEAIVRREELAHGGMSSGMVHLPTWRDELLPLLAGRAASREHPR